MKYRLGDICSITKGTTGIMKAIPGRYTMIALGETDKTHNEFQFDTKAVIIPLVSSTGHGHASMKRVKYCEGKFALGNILCAVIPNDESFVLAKYLHIYLHWNREELLVSQMKGMANVSLPMNRIADVMVTVPSIEKQTEIVQLEKNLIDKEIRANKLFADQLTQLENLNQAILQEAVQGKLVPQDPKDEPASELLKRINVEKAKLAKKEKPLPPIKSEEIPFTIPENWVWCRLGEIVLSAKDGPHFSPKYVEFGVPFISTRNISPDGVDFSSAKYISKEYHLEISKKCKPEIGDLLYTKGGTTGIATVNTYDFEFNVWVHVAVLKMTPFVNPFFLKFALNSPHCYKQSQELTRGIGNQDLGLTRMVSITIPLPPLSEQKLIVAEIDKQLAKTKQLKELIIANQQATEQLLKALLHQAFEVNEKETV